MNTQKIKDFYNTNLRNNNISYEQHRWFSSPQAIAGYKNTKSALVKYALPYIENGQKVFELGPGPGTWTKELLKKAPQAEYDLVDISEEMLKQAKNALVDHENIQYLTSDILNFTPDKEYDFFFSSRIIEYVPEKEQVILTISDALKSGAYGYIVTKTPQYTRRASNAVSANVHQEQISDIELSSMLEKVGCSVMTRLHVTCVFPKLHSGLLDRVLTKICRLLPFTFGLHVSESYALVFQKK